VHTKPLNTLKITGGQSQLLEINKILPQFGEVRNIDGTHMNKG
jgi:hypothetical protein